MTTTIHRSFRRMLACTGALAVAFLLSALTVSDAEARRLGGGKSFGRQFGSPTQQQRSAPPARSADQPAQQPNQAAPAQRPGQSAAAQGSPSGRAAGSRWLAPLTGIAAGLGIAALLSYLGLTGALAELLGSLLVIGLLAAAGVFVWRLLRGGLSAAPLQPAAPAYGAAAPRLQPRPGSVGAMSFTPPAAELGSVASPPAPYGVPVDFDTQAFLRNAKRYFVRLQAAWDGKDLGDIREFTTPEVFAELRIQMDEEPGTNKTDVVALDAELLGIDTTERDYLASVRFSGTMREQDDRGGAPEQDAHPFEEVWNLSKPLQGRGGWVLAGIQQVH
jgi:predicted lipid-binding transport protein (Tim44 family)